MINAYTCQWCGGYEKSPRRAPSFRMGSTVFEQWVCASCEAKAKEELDKFWSNHSSNLKSSDCCKCGCDLSGHEYFNAQKYANGDGSWKTQKVCRHCFESFCELCKCCSEK